MKTIVIFLIFFLSGCKLFSKSEVERAHHSDEAPLPGETLTDARIRTLNRFAENLLSGKDKDDIPAQVAKKFKAENISASPIGQAYTIQIRPGNTCFTDGGWFSDENDINWTRAKNDMMLQVEHVAEFVKKFYIDIKGNSKHPLAFDDVEICSAQSFPQKISLSGRLLQVFVSASGFSSYKIITADELRALWDAGVQNELPTAGLTNDQNQYVQMASKIMWFIFNPVGMFKTSMDGLLKQQQVDTTTEINNQKKIATQSAATRIASFMKTFTNLVNINLLSSPAQKSIEVIASEGKLNQLLDNWICLLKDQHINDRIGKGAMAITQKALDKEINNINIKLTSTNGAVYGNYHRIGVTFATDAGPYTRFVSELVFKKRETNVRVEASGKYFAGFTIDDVSVDVAIKVMTASLDKSLSTASLDDAIAATKRGEKLTCK